MHITNNESSCWIHKQLQRGLQIVPSADMHHARECSVVYITDLPCRTTVPASTLFPLEIQTTDSCFCSITGTPPWLLEMQELEVITGVKRHTASKNNFPLHLGSPCCNDEILGFFGHLSLRTCEPWEHLNSTGNKELVCALRVWAQCLQLALWREAGREQGLVSLEQCLLLFWS